MKVSTFVTNQGGCDYYRAMLPLETAKKYGAIKLDITRTTTLGSSIFLPKQYFETTDSDIYLFPRPQSTSLQEMLRKVLDQKAKGSKFVVEYDDNIFSVSPLSPHYRDYGTEEYKIRMPDGSMKDLWVDGENIDLVKNRHMIGEVKRAFEAADMVVTTTDLLADQFRQFNGNVRVLPNCVDIKRFNRLPIENKEIRLFWAGGWSHYEDLVQIKEPLRQVMETYPNVKLVLMGYTWPSLFKDIPQDRIEFHDWEEVAAYPLMLSILNPDIALIPLKDTTFNRCKSPIKWIEMGALSIPSVTSFIPPYAAMADMGDDNGIFIEENDKDGWVKGLSLLIEDADMRKRMGASARKTVETHFDINTQYHAWVIAFEEALCQFPATRT